MSYRCGISEGVARATGIEAGPPRIICDGCGAYYEVRARGAGGAPPVWFIEGKAPPKWRLERDGDARRDYCPECRERPRAAGGGA